MTRVRNHRILLAALLVGSVLLMPLTVEAARGTWLDELTGFVMFQKEIAQKGTFDPSLSQLRLVRKAFSAGDRDGTYVAMNRFMDMLEAREGGISAEAADAIWDFCYQVTPAGYHNVSRHLKANPDYLKELEFLRAMEERAAISF